MSQPGSRGWIFSLFQESVTFRYLVLALASFYLQSGVHHGISAGQSSPSVVLRSWRAYHGEALQYMQRKIHQLAQLQSSDDNHLRIKMRITLLACTWQLVELAVSFALRGLVYQSTSSSYLHIDDD